MATDVDNGKQAAAATGLDLLCELIRRASVTPEDAGCQQLLAARLSAAGFACESIPQGAVSNLWARRGTEPPLLCFAGHTDVVPPGPAGDWHTDPFEPTLIDGQLHGRGAADMKGGLVSMLLAVERFFERHPRPAGSIAMLITSDEEGPAIDGTRKVLEVLDERGEKIDYCIVGEPSSSHELGDVVRIGRRGSLSGKLAVRGVQGHVAYPQHADNPIHRFAPALNELQQTRWDDGNAHFPPTGFQMVEVQAGVGAANVTPPYLHAEFNFRYSNEWHHDALQEKVEKLLAAHALDFDLTWTLYGMPYLTEQGPLIEAAVAAVEEQTGITPQLSTGGGTSDGRFIAKTGAQVIELGHINETVHRANECVRAEDLAKLAKVYARMAEILLGD
ncbi:MAG: succinyl-diaminopimelate desuccinylase [Woeseiaceae bacterium]|nr:succinyl-diaminopimelate desuccinylase [Woeseiaceae bacterium]